MLSTWHRLEKVIKWAGLSVNAFALHIGLKRSENLYQIKKGNNGISRDLADLIIAKYPSISKGWLLTGEGDMLKGEMETGAASIPLYSTDVVSLVQNKFSLTPTSKMIIPIFNDCDFAAPYLSDSMAGDINPGSFVICKKVAADQIIPGACYLVHSDNFIGVRYLRNITDSVGLGYFRLEACNRDKYDDFLLSVEDIRSLYEVKGVLAHKIL